MDGSTGQHSNQLDGRNTIQPGNMNTIPGGQVGHSFSVIDCEQEALSTWNFSVKLMSISLDSTVLNFYSFTVIQTCSFELGGER